MSTLSLPNSFETHFKFAPDDKNTDKVKKDLSDELVRCYACGYIDRDTFDKLSGKGHYKFSKQEKLNPNNIAKVIFNPPATIVIFKDGTKEIVKTHGEVFDPEKGLAIAMLNIIFDNNKSKLKRFINKYVEESKKKK